MQDNDDANTDNNHNNNDNDAAQLHKLSWPLAKSAKVAQIKKLLNTVHTVITKSG